MSEKQVTVTLSRADEEILELTFAPDGEFELRWAEALEQLTTAIKRAEGGDEL